VIEVGLLVAREQRADRTHVERSGGVLDHAARRPASAAALDLSAGRIEPVQPQPQLLVGARVDHHFVVGELNEQHGVIRANRV